MSSSSPSSPSLSTITLADPNIDPALHNAPQPMMSLIDQLRSSVSARGVTTASNSLVRNRTEFESEGASTPEGSGGSLSAVDNVAFLRALKRTRLGPESEQSYEAFIHVALP